MTSPGRLMFGAEPADWVQLHNQRWLTDRHNFQDAVGRLMSQALRGDELLLPDQPDPNGPARIQFRDLPPSDRSVLDLPIPSHDEDGKPRTKGIDVQALLLPVAVTTDPVWAMKQFADHTWTELSSSDAVVCSLILAPVMTELAGILRLRAGEGPKTDKGRAEKLLRCRQAHEALGLRSDLIDPLLDPTLDRGEVVAARERLVRSWAQHPDDLGARVMALLCARVVRAYYSKARKDGTVQEARVITTSTKPLLDATLRDWSSLIRYLGEELATSDARPEVIPDTVLPQMATQPIAERLAVLRDWWEFYDARHAAQQPGAKSLDDLVPPRWFYADSEDPAIQRRPSDLYRTEPPPDLVARIEHVEYEAGEHGPGTDVELRGVSAADIEAAKALFLRFSPDEPIETTTYGQVLRRGDGDGRVYITGAPAPRRTQWTRRRSSRSRRVARLRRPATPAGAGYGGPPRSRRHPRGRRGRSGDN